MPTSDEDQSYEPKKKWNYKRIILISGVILIVVAVIVVLVVVLTGGDGDEQTTLAPTDSTADTTTPTGTTTELPLDEITLDDILSGVLSPTHFSSRWIIGNEILLNDDDGLKLFDVLTDTYTLLLAKEDDDLLSNAFTYSLSPGNTHVIVGYDQVKEHRHSYEASYSVIKLISDDATSDESNDAGQIIKIFINDPSDKLTLVEWNPENLGLVIVYKNNIYYKPDLEADPFPITRDGSNKIFNGVPDWVYEEEIFGSNSALRFSPDGTKLAYIRFDDTYVNTFDYIYYGEPGTEEAQYPINLQISYPKAGSTNPTVTAFVYDVRIPPSELFPIARFEIPIPTELSTVERIITTLSWANDNRVVVTWMNRVQNQAYIQVCNLPRCSIISDVKSADGWVELFSDPLYNEDGSQFALIMSHDQGGDAGSFRHITLLSAEDGQQIWLTTGKYVVTQLIHWDFELNYIFYSANTEDDSRVSHIYAIKAEHDAEPQCLTSELDLMWGSNYQYFSAIFSNAGKLIGLNSLGPAIPRSDIFSYTEVDNIINLTHERVWKSNEELQENLANLNTPTVEYDDEILLSSDYTAQVSMILPSDTDRSGTTKYPVLIYVCGKPDSYSVTYEWGITWGTYLAAAKNIIYVRIDGRGSALRGDKMLNEIYRKLGTVEIEDQIETAKKLADKYVFIDRDRIAIWGWSYGGYAAGLALAKDSEGVFNCAASISPVTDWTYYDTIYTERYMGLPTQDDNADGYSRSRLSTLYEEFKEKNFFLIHGTLDDKVHFQQAMALSRTLEKNAVYFKQMSYPDEDHSLSGVLPHLYMTLERYFSDCFHLEH